MSSQTYEKPLTANDTGETGGHQAGIHIPKSQTGLLELLPFLDPAQKNPDAWLETTDDTGTAWNFRYIHYNNQLHDEGGTRNEFRITHMTQFFRAVGATKGDILVIEGEPTEQKYKISVRKQGPESSEDTGASSKIRLMGWRRVH